MIVKISRGWRPSGLVYYLMGPGRANEHTGQRVVASWDGAPEMHQPVQAGDGSFDVRALVDGLSAAAVAAGVGLGEPVAEQGKRMRQGPVWHCSLRNSPEDPVLSDEQWARVVEDLMDRTGIARRGDPDGCRWVAIRHADDHVHVAAVLVRQESGRKFSPSFDKRRARETCQVWEERLGLVRTAVASDLTAVSAPKYGELEKAKRVASPLVSAASVSVGSRETPREWLRRMVRSAAVVSRDPMAFVASLEDVGVMVRPRTGGRGESGDDGSSMVGYCVAVPGDVNASGDPVWFSGSTLAPDLSLPALQRRWASAPPPPVAVEDRPYRARVGPQERAAAIAGAISAMERATAALTSSATGAADAGGDGIAHAAGDMLTAVQSVSELQIDVMAGRPGSDFDRATRVPGQGQPVRWSPEAMSLRQAAWRLAAIRTVGRRGSGDAARLTQAVTTLVGEIAALRLAQSRWAQARAAERCQTELRQMALSSVGAGAPEAGAPQPEMPRPQRGTRQGPGPAPAAGTGPPRRRR
ncbi:relaxase/mobilization nuclease domain-containing protein [Pseudonocardia sp. ICBG601]|uniref:relaxase/mobilization nuclease domain-containing protein n=1 Tax=Pseudonocardia sp. ICBG601 TaxID=2846759 RepID=UPI001CF71456|nr:relaxase/mobilization nuclease domain-containing protein [Pseudonocardia sp. ICBG601]